MQREVKIIVLIIIVNLQNVGKMYIQLIIRKIR